jgi:hypothetical protein
VLVFEVEEIDIADPSSHQRVQKIRCLNHLCEEFRVGFEAEEDTPNPMTKILEGNSRSWARRWDIIGQASSFS